MDNSQNTAYPVVLPHSECDYTKGITKLEAFTLAAMQGLCAAPNKSDQILNSSDEAWEFLATHAVKIAKATLAELSKSDTNV